MIYNKFNRLNIVQTSTFHSVNQFSELSSVRAGCVTCIARSTHWDHSVVLLCRHTFQMLSTTPPKPLDGIQ